ncbi:SAM-dependent methyltransferase [Amycolatopsis anabasis]|uniref:SAM-dependent methyltransferase n=1 Tax=Amycolatopsis anabasis TaxID=1840409 RepID=UPI00131A6A3A|nr:SAM-dependent methyltransferase [Amycolatopsis anabasis]
MRLTPDVGTISTRPSPSTAMLDELPDGYLDQPHSGRIVHHWQRRHRIQDSGTDAIPATEWTPSPDRMAAERIRDLWPAVSRLPVHSHEFVRRATTAAWDAGIRQFVDLHPGMPSEGSVPAVIADLIRRNGPNQASSNHRTRNALLVQADPPVRAHWQRYQDRAPVPRLFDLLDGDVCDPRHINDLLCEESGVDIMRPVCLILAGLLHQFHRDQAAALLRDYQALLAPGSMCVLTHLAVVPADPAVARRARRAHIAFKATSHPVRPATPQAVADLFATPSWAVLEPGIVPAFQWRPDPVATPHTKHDGQAGPFLLAAVARKNRPSFRQRK